MHLSLWDPRVWLGLQVPQWKLSFIAIYCFEEYEAFCPRHSPESSYTTENTPTERACKPKIHLELIPSSGHYFGLWDSPWKGLKRFRPFPRPPLGLPHCSHSWGSGPPAAAVLPSAEQLQETHRICDLTSQRAFVRLSGFGVPGAFMVHWLLPSERDTLLTRKLARWFFWFLLTQRPWLAFWMYSWVQNNLSSMYFSSLCFFISI